MQRKLSDCETKGRPISHKLYTCLLVSNFKWFVILFIKSHYTESSMIEEKNLKPYSTIRQIIFTWTVVQNIANQCLKCYINNIHVKHIFKNIFYIYRIKLFHYKILTNSNKIICEL